MATSGLALGKILAVRLLAQCFCPFGASNWQHQTSLARAVPVYCHNLTKCRTPNKQIALIANTAKIWRHQTYLPCK
jgi:hypothetical protein